jgi:DSF synthase
MDRVREICRPVSLHELMQVTEAWVDTAMQLGDKSLRTMERLVRAQEKRPAHVVEAPAAYQEPVLQSAAV